MRSIECAAAERWTRSAVSAAPEGLAAAARDAAMEVPINVRRFMGRILLPLGGKRAGDWEKRRAVRTSQAALPGLGVRNRTASRTACGADRGSRSGAERWWSRV